jgi:hypothetical protein
VPGAGIDQPGQQGQAVDPARPPGQCLGQRVGRHAGPDQPGHRVEAGLERGHPAAAQAQHHVAHLAAGEEQILVVRPLQRQQEPGEPRGARLMARRGQGSLRRHGT